jgi:hypothetical protein
MNKKVPLVSFLACAYWLGACLASPPETGLPPDAEGQGAWRTYTSDRYQIRIEVPPEWEVVEPPIAEYPNVVDQLWLIGESSPQPGTGARADIVLTFTREDPSPGWAPGYYDDYKSDIYWLGDIEGRKISGINKESGFPESVVLARIGEYYLQASPNQGAASLGFFDQVVSSLRAIEAGAATPSRSEAGSTGDAEKKTAAYEGMSFTYPAWLAQGANGQMISAYSDPGGFIYDNFPEHLRFDFIDPYTRREPFAAFQPGWVPWLSHQNPETPEIQPQIFIYPVADLDELAGDRAAALKALLDGGLPTSGGELPVLPTFNSAQDLHGQIKPLTFHGGKGYRFIARYSQGMVPVANPDVFYTFQGLTEDGSLYVAAFFPINVSILPDQAEVEDWEAFNLGYREYMAEITARLDGLDPRDFAPDLDSLDALISSIVVDGAGISW